MNCECGHERHMAPCATCGCPACWTAHDAAESVCDEWEELEGETFRPGHRSTLVRLIEKRLENWGKR